MTIDEKKILDMYQNEYINEDISMEKLAKKHDVSAYKIKKWFDKLGLKIKSRSEQNRTYKINENYFDVIDTEEKAYWLGFLYADGCVFLGNDKYKMNTIALSLQLSDYEHVNKFVKAIGSNKEIKIVKGGTQARIDIANKKMANDLNNLGCVPNKTFKTKYPTENIIPKHLQHHFIRGVFDGDGCISLCYEKNRKTPHVDFQILGTENLLNGISEYLYSTNKLLKKP